MRVGCELGHEMEYTVATRLSNDMMTMISSASFCSKRFWHATIFLSKQSLCRNAASRKQFAQVKKPSIRRGYPLQQNRKQLSEKQMQNFQGDLRIPHTHDWWSRTIEEATMALSFFSKPNAPLLEQELPIDFLKTMVSARNPLKRQQLKKDQPSKLPKQQL